MTIEGASAAEDKNGDLLGFATTDEIGSVMDMTNTKNFYENETGDWRSEKTLPGGVLTAAL